jgi:hypothetical protein
LFKFLTKILKKQVFFSLKTKSNFRIGPDPPFVGRNRSFAEPHATQSLVPRFDKLKQKVNAGFFSFFFSGIFKKKFTGSF